MSFLDGRAIRDWCRQRFQLKDDILKTVENVTENTEEGKSVDALVIKEVFQNVSDGKVLLASAITDKGVLTDAEDSFAVMAGNIGQIEMGSSGSSGNGPIESPYLFELGWTFAVGSAGSIDIRIPFPVKKLTKFVIKRLYFYMSRQYTGNSIGISFSIYGKKKGATKEEYIKSYYMSVASTGTSTATGANITDLEIDLSEWEEINYCKISKSNTSGTFTYANVTLTFQAELYF